MEQLTLSLDPYGTVPTCVTTSVPFDFDPKLIFTFFPVLKISEEPVTQETCPTPPLQPTVESLFSSALPPPPPPPSQLVQTSSSMSLLSSYADQSDDEEEEDEENAAQQEMTTSTSSLSS
jgi:hypothetical protein